MTLIDKDALMKYPIRIDNYDKKNGNEHFVLGIESVLEFAEYLPAVDAVEVVFCKNCIYQKDATVNCKGFIICPVSNMEITDDDYCSYGECRESEVSK